MKILNVYFKNINSLAGESRIDFDKAPIADAGVFAITGPNGSGKSSILDAITLALYGETFRFNKPAENVMTKNTIGCFAQVEFLVEGEKYRSSWQVQRQNAVVDGDVLPDEMQLLHLIDGAEDKVLEQEAHKVLALNAQLTGMDFRRFTRSIMLAQGDFAAFLNALDSERLDILERIISHDIYDDHKGKLEQQAREAEQTLSDLQTRLAGLDLMTEAQQEAAQHDLADQKLSFAELKQEKSDLLQTQASLQDIQQLERNIERLEQSQQQEQQQLAAVQADLETITKADDILAFEPSLQQIAEYKAGIAQTQQKTTQLQQDIQRIIGELAAKNADEQSLAALSRVSPEVRQKKIVNLRAQIEQTQTEISDEAQQLESLERQLAEKKQTFSVVETWMGQHKSDGFLIENMPELGKLKNLRQRSIDIQKQLKVYQKVHKSTTSAADKNQTRLTAARKEIASLEKMLTKLNAELGFIADGHTLEAVASLRSEQKQRVADFTELLNLAKVHKKFVKRGFSKRYADLNRSLLDKQLAAKNDQLESAEMVRQILEKAVYREELIIKLTADREKLEHDTPCPLCGSYEHPYVKNPPELRDSKRALADQLASLKALQADVKKITSQINAYTKVDAKNKEHAERINRVKADWLTLCTRLNAANRDFTLSSFRSMRKRIKAEKKELKAVSALLKRFQAKKKEIAKVETSLVKKQVILKRLLARQEEIQDKGQERPQELVNIEAELAKCMQDESVLTKIIGVQLREVGDKLPVVGKEDALYDRLSRRRQDYQTYHLREQSLGAELAEIGEKVTLSRSTLQNLQQQQQAYLSDVQEQELAGLYFARIDNEALLKKAERELEQLKGQLKAKNDALQVQLGQSSYDSLEQVQEVLTLCADREKKQAQLTHLQQALQAYPDKLAAVRQQLSAERAHIASDETLESLVIKLREKSVQMDIVASEAATLEKRLAEQASLQQNNIRLLQDIEQQQAVVQQAMREQQQIADEPESVFRRRVQAAVVDKLLGSTNQFLDKISGRYQVRRVNSEVGLAIEIADLKLMNSQRSVKSLSGGEAFVVSLAMALGLSEIANNGKAIDSLFIDEGFGNLDAETLYTVMTTLESLKTHGKTVGVISHVEGVKQRIKAQIELVKQPNGVSRIVLQHQALQSEQLVENVN